MDHFYQLPGIGAPDEPMFECYTMLSALAQHTETVRLSALVTGNTYRNPALLAKIVTTLDVVSNGRGQLGIGAGPARHQDQQGRRDGGGGTVRRELPFLAIALGFFVLALAVVATGCAPLTAAAPALQEEGGFPSQNDERHALDSGHVAR